MACEDQYYESPSLWTRGRYEKGIERQRLEAILGWIPDDVRTVLDAGCGNGDLTHRLGSHQLVAGVDRSSAALQWVQMPCARADIAHMPFPGATFDLLIAAEVIEHLPCGVFEQALRELVRVARKYILISVPYRERLRSRQVTCPVCKCHYHKYLHMRSFDLDILNDLFDGWEEVELVKAEGIVRQKRPRFVETLILLQHILFPSSIAPSRSALCPQCGYCQASHGPLPVSRALERKRVRLKSLVRSVWPKQSIHWWWLALYRKVG